LENNNKPASEKRREIKSYVLRQGRLTQAQQQALEQYWPDYGIDYQDTELSLEQVFNNRHGVVIEIGFGNGESLLEQARNHPEYNYIGVEVHTPGVGHLIHLAHAAGISNLRVIRHDAVEVLHDMIADNSIEKVQLLFPDPWHKKRHHKRRIIKPDFIRLVHKKLTDGGLFHMATDWQPYAEAMLEQMEASPAFENTAGKGQYSPHRGDRSETKFERRGRQLGHQVFDLIYRKAGKKSGS
jgi:tRNA (guanine-N7-)-methyltransferase